MSNCPNCLQIYNHLRRPFILSCGHSTCEICLQTPYLEIQCLICKLITPVSQLRFLPQNLSLLDVLDEIKTQGVASQKSFWDHLSNLQTIKMQFLQQSSITNEVFFQFQLYQQYQEISSYTEDVSPRSQCAYPGCGKRRFMYDGLESIYCSSNCYKKWKNVK